MRALRVFCVLHADVGMTWVRGCRPALGPAASAEPLTEGGVDAHHLTGCGCAGGERPSFPEGTHTAGSWLGQRLNVRTTTIWRMHPQPGWSSVDRAGITNNPMLDETVSRKQAQPGCLERGLIPQIERRQPWVRPISGVARDLHIGHV